jgi:hypothetical protein
MNKKGKIYFVIFSLLLFTLLASPASADHSWGSYHWARTTNPFTLKLGDNVSSTWDSYLNTTSNDWSASVVLNTTKVIGLTTPKTCKGTTGRVEVCNSKYGNNGWLGIAQIWASGNHITKGVTKMNDTYFSRAQYNTPTWKNLVLCQEVGHTLGLDHQDEIFDNPNLDTCMDYTNNPESNQNPNTHDYDMLATIYEHLDSITTILNSTVNGNPQVDLNNPSEWGQSIKESADKKTAVFEKDLGQGNKMITHVFWAK